MLLYLLNVITVVEVTFEIDKMGGLLLKNIDVEVERK